MLRILNILQKAVIYILLCLMTVVVILSTLELGWMVLREIVAPPMLLLGLDDMVELLGMFMMVLISLELLHTIRMYIINDHIPVEEVFLVAMIAVARKVIVADHRTMEPLVLLGLSAMVIGLGASYYMVKKQHVPAAGGGQRPME